MKLLMRSLSALLLLFPVIAPVQAAVSQFLIIPGQSIGKTYLGPNGLKYLHQLPAPTASSNGMMQREIVWVSHPKQGTPQTLFIHTVDNGVYTHVSPRDGVTIDSIRITSPAFHTPSGLSTHSLWVQIQHHYPHLTLEMPFVYADKSRGIAFEFASAPKPASRCTAIMVFPDGHFQGETALQVQNILDSPSPSHVKRLLRRG